MVAIKLIVKGGLFKVVIFNMLVPICATVRCGGWMTGLMLQWLPWEMQHNCTYKTLYSSSIQIWEKTCKDPQILYTRNSNARIE